jgi:hypothetical protein
MGFGTHVGTTHSDLAQDEANKAFDRTKEKIALALDAFTGDIGHKNLAAIKALEELVDRGLIGAVLSGTTPAVTSPSSTPTLASASGLMLGAGSNPSPATNPTPSTELVAGTELVTRIGSDTTKHAQVFKTLEAIMSTGTQAEDFMKFIEQTATEIAAGRDSVKPNGLRGAKTLASVLAAQTAQTNTMDRQDFYTLASIVSGTQVQHVVSPATVISNAQTKMDALNAAVKDIAVALSLPATSTKDEVVTAASRLATTAPMPTVATVMTLDAINAALGNPVKKAGLSDTEYHKKIEEELKMTLKGRQLLAEISAKHDINKSDGTPYQATDDMEACIKAIRSYSATAKGRLSGLK